MRSCTEVVEGYWFAWVQIKNRRISVCGICVYALNAVVGVGGFHRRK